MTLRIRLSPRRESTGSITISSLTLPSRMPPTPGMSEVEAVPPSPRERTSGTLATLLQRAQLLRLRNKRKTKSQNSNWVGEEKKNTWICSKLIGRQIQQCGRLTIKVCRQLRAALQFCFFPDIGQLNSKKKTLGHHSLFLSIQQITKNKDDQIHNNSAMAGRQLPCLDMRCKWRDVDKVKRIWSDWLCRRWPSSWISAASIFPSQGALWSNSQTGSLAQWCHQTADHGPEREQEGGYWHRSGCCALWHSGLADLWGWGDSALALGLGKRRFLAGFLPSLTPSQESRSQDGRFTLPSVAASTTLG